MKGITLVRRLLVLGALFAVSVFAMPAAAVTDGELDGNGHPAVVLLLMEVNGAPRYRCSATLLSAKVVLTAGHCTNNYPGSPYTGMRVFVESDVDNGSNNYPLAGPNAYEAESWAAHPLYPTAPFFVHDVGVVVLAGARPDGVVAEQLRNAPDRQSARPTEDQAGAQNVTFTSVGYRLQQINPVFMQADRARAWWRTRT